MASGISTHLRVAVVGADAWGEQHTRIFARRPDTELVAVVGHTEEWAAQRASASGTTAYTSIDEMIARARPDLVTTSLPNEPVKSPGWVPTGSCSSVSLRS